MKVKSNQYVYILKLIPRLLVEENWTEGDNEIVSRHFYALKNLKVKGKLILAGRTLNEDESSFGIVILKADTENEATELMENDPAVKEGIMTAKLFPYRVALIAEDNV